MSLLQKQCDVFCAKKKTKVTLDKNARLAETSQMGISALLFQGLLSLAIVHKIPTAQDL